MILAVETNFILELVLGQREAAACESLLELSRGSLVIFIPAFSVAEATMVVERRQGERREFIDNTLQRHLREANRSTLLARLHRHLLRSRLSYTARTLTRTIA